jgi:MoaA/NifB/PqqE/SkfB family radical SAM enzyme
MNFPESISLTITNHCNLRCRMCGQWSEEGYIRRNTEGLSHELSLNEWKAVVDELSGHNIPMVLLRGGEPFMFPGVVELLEYIHEKGMFILIDTNGTMLKQHAEDIVRIGNIHLTVSVDGSERVHDSVRGVPGSFQRIKDGLARLAELEFQGGNKISRSICFTISQYNYLSLGAMPGVARSLGLGSIAIVPYYYFPLSAGRRYEKELRSLGCQAYTWAGFHHEVSGVDFEEFQRQYRKYLVNLGEISNYPYMPLDEQQYRAWFTDAHTPVGYPHCLNIEKLIDIQPDGSANFCVDFIDYSFGNVREACIEELWNSERAERFRTYRRERPLAVCQRCGSKYMSQPWSEYGQVGFLDG